MCVVCCHSKFTLQLQPHSRRGDTNNYADDYDYADADGDSDDDDDDNADADDVRPDVRLVLLLRSAVRPCAAPWRPAAGGCWPTAAPAASRRWCRRRGPHRRAAHWPPLPWPGRAAAVVRARPERRPRKRSPVCCCCDGRVWWRW